MEIQAVIFDIDGTIYINDEKRVLPSTKKALIALREKNIKLAICTSRCPEELIAFPQDIIDLMDLMIYAGGAKITEQGKTIYLKAIDAKVANEVITYLNKNDIVCRYSTSDDKGYFAKERSKEVDSKFRDLYGMLPELKEYEGEECINLLFYLRNEKELEEIRSIAKNSTVLPIGIPTEITAFNVNKLTGIEEACKHWGISLEKVMAFGDGVNDIEMLRGIGYGVAMGNANPRVKEVAKEVTSDYKNDGIYNLLMKHEIII